MSRSIEVPVHFLKSSIKETFAKIFQSVAGTHLLPPVRQRFDYLWFFLGESTRSSSIRNRPKEFCFEERMSRTVQHVLFHYDMIDYLLYIQFNRSLLILVYICRLQYIMPCMVHTVCLVNAACLVNTACLVNAYVVCLVYLSRGIVKTFMTTYKTE